MAFPAFGGLQGVVQDIRWLCVARDKEREMHPYLRKRCVTVWYRYPSDSVPREVKLRIASPQWSIADAVSLQIARDYDLTEVLQSTQPTESIKPLLAANPHFEFALQWASIRPPEYVPFRRSSTKRGVDHQEGEEEELPRKRARGVG